MRENSIEHITKRMHRYWYEDGIWEIGFGLVNLLLAAFYLIVTKVRWEGPLIIVLPLLQIGVTLGVYFMISRVVKFLKEHITYPRTGYVAYHRPPVKARLKRIALTALISGGTAALLATIATLHRMESVMPLVIGTVMAIAMVYLGIRLGLLRLYFVAAAVILIGYSISLANLPDMLSTAVFFGGFGLLLLISGTLVLLDYMQRTRPADQQLDYEAPQPDADEDANG